jgi:hypothetical protein
MSNAIKTVHKLVAISWHLVSQLPEYGQGEPETGLALAVLTLSHLEHEAKWQAKFEANQFCDEHLENTGHLFGLVANFAVHFDVSKQEADSYVRLWLKGKAPVCEGCSGDVHDGASHLLAAHCENYSAGGLVLPMPEKSQCHKQ